MSSLILPRRFNQQPQGRVEVDWSNPLTRGLVDAIETTGQVPRSVVLGTPATSFGTLPKSSATEQGIAIDTRDAFGGWYFQRGDGLYAQAAQSHVSVGYYVSADSQYDGIFSAAKGDGSANSLSLVKDSSTTFYIWNATASTAAFTNPLTSEWMVLGVSAPSSGTSTTYKNGVIHTSGIARNPTAQTTSRLVLFGERTANASFSVKGMCALHLLYGRALSDEEHLLLAANPWQIFRRSPQVLYFDVGGGGTTLTVADALHAHAADNLDLTSSHQLTVADATHAHAADSLSLTSQILLSLSDALHGHTADNLTLDTAASLAVQDATHAHTADNLDLTALSVLVVAEALHSHLADNVTLSVSGAASLIIADALHAHAADNLDLTSQMLLAIAESAHAHSADNVVITSEHVLAVADALHAHAADNLSLSDIPSLTIADAGHAHTADNLALTTDSLLAIADAAHAHLADGVSLTYAATLAIVEAMHVHLADNVTLNLLVFAVLDMLVVEYDRRIRVIEYDQRIRKI